MLLEILHPINREGNYKHSQVGCLSLCTSSCSFLSFAQLIDTAAQYFESGPAKKNDQAEGCCTIPAPITPRSIHTFI